MAVRWEKGGRDTSGTTDPNRLKGYSILDAQQKKSSRKRGEITGEITEQLKVEGTAGGHLVQKSLLLQIAQDHVKVVSEDIQGGDFTASLDNLCHC